MRMGAGQIFNFILKCHCTDDFSRQVARYFPATAKVVGTRQIKNLSCTHADLPDGHFVYTHTQLHNDKWITIEVQVENQPGKEDNLTFKYLTELVTETLEVNDAIN